MTTVLQVSDPHFGTERAAAVEALVAMAHEQRPDLVVLSGDITQRARRAQFRAARAFADRLGAPLLAIPGNHDIPLFNVAARLGWPYAGQRAAFGDDLEPSHITDELLVLGVNTTRWWRHTDGDVSARQIERVAHQLTRATPSQLRIVVVHQPAAALREQDLSDCLHNRDAALQRWAAAGADIVMGGHIHLPYVLARTDLARPLWVVQAGTAVSNRVRHDSLNSVNLLRWDGTHGVVEQWDCAPGGAFGCAHVTALAPARGPA